MHRQTPAQIHYPTYKFKKSVKRKIRKINSYKTFRIVVLILYINVLLFLILVRVLESIILHIRICNIQKIHKNRTKYVKRNRKLTENHWIWWKIHMLTRTHGEFQMKPTTENKGKCRIWEVIPRKKIALKGYL